MGAWNYGVFDDDTAYDALIDLKGSSDIIADMEQYLMRLYRLNISAMMKRITL